MKIVETNAKTIQYIMGDTVAEAFYKDGQFKFVSVDIKNGGRGLSYRINVNSMVVVDDLAHILAKVLSDINATLGSTVVTNGD